MTYQPILGGTNRTFTRISVAYIAMLRKLIYSVFWVKYLKLKCVIKHFVGKFGLLTLIENKEITSLLST